MARPIWSDAGDDPVAVADYLDARAEAGQAFEFVPVQAGDYSILRRAAVLRAKRHLQDRHGDKDRILAQEVRAIDDLVRTANLLIERLREWYALHAPEAVRFETDAERLTVLIAQHGDRAAVLEALGQANADATSLGTDMDDADMAGMRGFAAALQAVHETWRTLEIRIEQSMQTIAPNVAGIVGPVLGARLIAQAGSLQRLAMMPAGTVQTLGAEKALFRSIKEGTRPPKHGFLFQHPKVHQALHWQRGAVARALALHAATAAKADAFTQNDLLADLQESLAKSLARIAKSKAVAPAKPAFVPRGKPRGPPRDGGRGPPRDNRGPPRGPARGPPRDGRGPPKDGGRGPPRGPPRDSRGPPRGPPRDNRGPRTGSPPPRKAGAGAFRNQGSGPAKPPGKGNRGERK